MNLTVNHLIMLKEFRIQLIKTNHILLIVLIAVGCKQIESNFDVDTALTRYNLVYDANTGHDLYHSNWMRKGTIYGNRATDSCLVVIINKKGDTILTHLDKGIQPWYLARMMKVGNVNFVIKRDFRYVESDTTNAYYNTPSVAVEDSYNDIDYPMDSYFRLDSINRKLELIKPVSKTEVLKKIKEKFNFKENVKILASTNKYTYIAKDTLNDSQVYYQINTTYVPKKRNSDWVLEPTISSKFADLYKMGIYRNNISSNIEKFGNTLVKISIDSIGQNVSKYDLYLKSYSKFFCDTVKYKRCRNKVVKLEVIVHERTKKNKTFIKTFINNSIFENQSFNMFKYKNADYFIGVLPSTEDRIYKNSLFRLDTINWKLDQVEKFDKKRDINFKLYKKHKSALVSGDAKNEVSNFLEAYEIVKVGNRYKLIGSND